MERRAKTRSELVEAADRLFTRHGFHATSLDSIADEAGYTKGAVYSNFSAKEDLFFAVYEQRVARGVAEMEDRLAKGPDFARVMEGLAADSAARRANDDGWLAVFFEFWAHVLRHPEHRARFAELHAAAIEPAVAGLTRHAGDRGIDLPDHPRKLATAWYAMQVGLSLERLTQPEVVDARLGARMARLAMQDLEGGQGS
jgi:AcrR family transcriptional regulator